MVYTTYLTIRLEIRCSQSSLTKLCSSDSCAVTKDFDAAVLFR